MSYELWILPSLKNLLAYIQNDLFFAIRAIMHELPEYGPNRDFA